MLVLGTADGWKLVEQVDHAVLSGQLAAAWGAGRFAAADSALVLAALRHDEGWAVWDRYPLLSADGEPMSFLQAPVSSLLSSYTACVDAIAYEDSHAGLLVSRHVSGLRRRRYGLAPNSAARAAVANDAEKDPRIAAFVTAEEERQTRLRAKLALDESEERHEYALLQLFDVLSLQLCLTDLDGAGQRHLFDLAPTASGAAAAPLAIETLGGRRVAVEPWPFTAASLELTVPRRMLRPGRFANLQDLRQAWACAAPELLRIELTQPADSPSEPLASPSRLRGHPSEQSADTLGQPKR